MGAREDAGMLLVLVLFFLGPRERTAAGPVPQGVECIIFNEDYMTCDWGSKEKLTANYSFYYWYITRPPSPRAECKHYLQTDGINTGCWFNKSELQIGLNRFNVHINASQNGRLSTISAESLILPDLVVPSAPINLTLKNISNNQLQLTWKTPYKSNEGCLEHEVKYKSNKDTEWTKQSVTNMKFNIASVDPAKFYTFTVRSKISNLCGNTKLWSEDSGPVFWGGNSTNKDGVSSTSFWLQSVLIPIGSIFVLFLLLVMLMRMERVWLVLMPRIPNPSNKFEDLFTAYQGNFSEWAGVSKEAVESFKPNYRESICRVSKLLLDSGYLPVSSDAMSKAGTTLGVSVDSVPKANPE
ncbi:cytokine receptor common subunit gamma [Hemicordylus capensis]|uniref:cytokine receptor common subunit gamma n=1 Tax=Hemicordylus capensis TaxID=884348 RepID=UPI002303EA96|nr:cytokine receptor common subunit gamma [Hemicordylus capensis]